MTRLLAWWDYLRGTYWVVPSAMAVAAVILSVAMIQLDEATTARMLERWSWVYTGGPEGARAVLSTIAASMITVAGVTFSITIVALTLASQQFGPRLLKNFLRDLGNQVVLGTFVSTYLYCLLVLRTVRGSDDEEFVPHLAVTVGVVLAMLSLGVLIFFIHHVAISIQASRIIANVAADLEQAIDRLFPEALGEDAGTDPGRAPPEEPADRARVVRATTSGYVQAVDADGLMNAAREQDVVARVQARPGDFVRKGGVLLTTGAGARDNAPDDTPLREAFILGNDRTGAQDVTFFINQLVELAVRALSPGINDPGTARLCIDRLEQALCHLAGRRFPSPARQDDHGRVRVIAWPLSFESIVESAFAEITRHGRSNVSVSCRLLAAIQSVAPCVRRDADRRALLKQAAEIAAPSHPSPFTDDDREGVARCYREVCAALHERPGANRPSPGP